MLKHCGSHMHKHVRVQTLDGHIYEGMILHVDRSILYLQIMMQDPRSFVNPYNVILPLVLYELLVITLLYT
ncbi:acetyl-CoA acetyltransferase [Paenibacillus sp. GSMTC-2017]|nr:acetyl-CoA acetyltransferase [Paenibacillus sp. GSMTC-2017]MBH5318679.1 acetyl-CoA acetyltransferase [Paenibacillus sp. GSMTC-2017]